ncbi:DNA repair exonuclease [Cyanobium sp. NIES-981]|uniref:metallophosphoesterase family protein n=1 Tax=Cyanobium sp. NIES-981 TaxID=1851505 RepID=UPI0007DE1A14|nr:DNA repair exonuclease [Cyanobium sp. NIES-981]SBO42692.1 DNA repair exonuclease [Cyanobium sp. NIES-981]
MLRFLHTADWQIGKPYARVADGDKRAQLRRERLDAIRRLGAVAREQGAAFILVAGDLFDSHQPTRADVSAACSAIGALELPVLVIPGNHDHGGPGSLWQEGYFREERQQLAPNLHVLLERHPFELSAIGLPTGVVLPCPLLRKAESVDPTAWLRNLDLSPWSEAPRLVLAHGSIQGFGSEDSGDTDDENPPVPTNRIDLAALPAGEIDYVALGDWHGLKQVGPRAWYAGCHEMDRFPRAADYRSGQVLVVQVERSAMPEVFPVATGGIRWHQIAHRFSSDDDLDRLEQRIRDAIGPRSNEDLLLLELEGSLSLAAASRLQDLLQRLEARLLRLKLRDRTSVAPDPAELRQLTERAGDPLVARVAQRLQQMAEAGEEEGELARMALRELHRACVNA